MVNESWTNDRRQIQLVAFEPTATKCLSKTSIIIKYGGNNGFSGMGGSTLWHTQEAYQVVKPIAHLIWFKTDIIYD